MPRIRQVDDDYDIMKLIKSIFERQGKDMTTCEYCGEKLKKPQFHHTKYEGATIYDLVVCCQKCNLKQERAGLK